MAQQSMAVLRGAIGEGDEKILQDHEQSITSVRCLRLLGSPCCRVQCVDGTYVVVLFSSLFTLTLSLSFCPSSISLSLTLSISILFTNNISNTGTSSQTCSWLIFVFEVFDMHFESRNRGNGRTAHVLHALSCQVHGSESTVQIQRTQRDCMYQSTSCHSVE